MPPTDPATIPLRECPVGAVFAWYDGCEPEILNKDDDWYTMHRDSRVILIAPSLAALVARAEAGARLAGALVQGDAINAALARYCAETEPKP